MNTIFLKKAVLLFPIMMIVFLASSCASNAYKHIDVRTAKKLMAQDPRPLVVDVRTQEEYNEGHIPGAILVPIDEIRNGHFEKLEDKNQVLLIYCRTGRRAEDAAEILAEEGYSKVYEFGGIVDWEEDTEKTDGK